MYLVEAEVAQESRLPVRLRLLYVVLQAQPLPSEAQDVDGGDGGPQSPLSPTEFGIYERQAFAVLVLTSESAAGAKRRPAKWAIGGPKGMIRLASRQRIRVSQLRS